MTQVAKTNDAYASPYRRKGDILLESGKDAKKAASQMGAETNRVASSGGGLLHEYATPSSNPPIVVADNSNSTFSYLVE